MASFPGVTEIMMYHLRDGIDLDTAMSEEMTAGQALHRLIDTIKSQPGLLRQYWGQQVEDPKVFVGAIGEMFLSEGGELESCELTIYVDWESFEEATAFRRTEENHSLTSELGQIFDLTKAAPLQMYARFNTDAAGAFQSGTTEIALYTVPTKDYTEDVRRAIDKSLDVPSMESIKQFGAGGATGWVFETRNDKEPEGHTIALLGVYGYPTVDHHRKWRASPEHAQVMKDLEAGGPEDIDMRSATVPGGGLFVPGEGIFHVKFRAGT